MDTRYIPTMILVWCVVVQIFLGSSKSIDLVLNHMCAKEYGAKFWRNLLECTIVLESEIRDVLNTCIPVSTEEEAEKTRCAVCSKPDQWIKMMDCMNRQLIKLQDETNPNLELSPGLLYKTCVISLGQEASRSVNENKTFLPEDRRSIKSNCSNY